MNKDQPDQPALEEQLNTLRGHLIQSEKMAGLGVLTAGVAHELNNPIAFVKNNLAILAEYMRVLQPLLREILTARQTPEGWDALDECIAALGGAADLEPILDDLEPLIVDTRDGIIRMAAIVDGLRRFARADPPAGEPFDLNRCVQDTLKVAWNELKYRAHVSQDLADLPFLIGKPGELHQVILNLLINAAQALTTFGEIHVRTRLLDGEIELSIADNGPGILPEHLERLFTPFFTTKPPGQGTGLGLAISREIVTAHGGRIEVRTAEQQGTEFRIYLPLPASAAPEEAMS